MNCMNKLKVEHEVSSGPKPTHGVGLAGLAKKIKNILDSCALTAWAETVLRHRGCLRVGCLLLASLMIFCQGGFYDALAQENASTVATDATADTTGGGNRPHADAAREDAVSAEPSGGPVEVRELWTGSLYSSTYRVGVCFSADGNVRGVLYLRLYNGHVDVYHIVGSVQNNEVRARHSSGHTFKGRLVSNDKVEGTITLKNGMKVQLEGKRILDVPLAPENCAPLPE
ncbi:hypothetical protein [Desulfovibrio sp. MES5]|uniref:hypothetical protein n=1 Tax=Desulfovibrio sp. MES5 TaxID=1899016 RepID=UPI0025B98B14|nr:hypothetical protein [Desulfovibrio sp. MES5]